MELVLYSIGFCVFLAALLVVATIYSKNTIVKSELSKKQLEIDHQKELVEQLIEVQEEDDIGPPTVRLLKSKIIDKTASATPSG